MRISLLALSIIAFTASAGFAQINSAENEFCHQDYAKFLVSQQVTESNFVTDAAKRIKILILAADFIWPYDETAGRTYFTDAFNAAVSHFRETGYETKKVSEDARSVSAQLPDQRFEVIKAVAKRDAEWARRLTDTVLKEIEANSKDAKDSDRSRELMALLQLADQSVEANPDLSWYLFRRAMRYPLGSEWYFYLYSVAGTDQRFADQLYIELITNYRNANLRSLLFLSAFPFGQPRIFGPDAMSFGVSTRASMTPNRELQRMFLETYFLRIAAVAADPNRTSTPAPQTFLAPEPAGAWAALQQLEPFVIAGHPELLQRLALAKAQANSMMTDEMRRDLGVREARASSQRSRSFDERLAELEERFEKGTLTDGMIVSMFTIQKLTEDQFAKLESWLDKIKEEKLRYEASNYFWFRRSQLATEERRFRDSEKYAEKVPEADHRAILAFEMVEMQLEDVNDASSATQTLSTVSKLAGTLGNSLVRARVRLGLANMYARVSPTFAINELSDAVAVMNQLKEPDLVSTTVYRQLIGKDFGHYTAYSVPSYSLEKTFKELSREDISLPLSNARTIDDKYLRAVAVLAVASNCIEKPKPKDTVDADY